MLTPTDSTHEQNIRDGVLMNVIAIYLQFVGGTMDCPKKL